MNLRNFNGKKIFIPVFFILSIYILYRIHVSSVPKVAFFISDHGYGHGTRSIPIIKKLAESAKVKVITGVPYYFFKGLDIEYLNFRVDVGVVQKTSIVIDFNKTLSSLEEYWDSYDTKKELLRNHLIEWGVTHIVEDTTPLGCSIAKEINVRCVGLSNFSWSWWWSHYVKDIPEFQKYISLIEKEYLKLDLFMRYPYTENITIYNSIKQAQLEWVVPPNLNDKNEIRRRLKIEGKLLLYTFGGHKFNFENCKNWEIPSGWKLIIFLNKLNLQKLECNNERIIKLNDQDLIENNLKFLDLLSSVDVVVTKLGFGTVQEIIVNGISCLYVGSRKGFVEQKQIIRAIQENVSSDEVSIFEIENASKSLFEKADKIVPNIKKTKIGTNGAEQAKNLILKKI